MAAPKDRASRLDASRGWIGMVRRDWRGWLTTRNGAGVITAIVIVAVVMSALPPNRPLPSSEPSSSPSPGASPSVTSPPDAAWGNLDLPAWEPLAELRPVDVDASGVAVGSAFVLRSRTGVGAVQLAAGLTSEPPITFVVAPGPAADEATVQPDGLLMKGTVYRIRLVDPSGALAGSWAYRTERPLHVVSSVPGNETTGVPLNTGIEVEFDQDGVTDISRQFSIDPPAAGRFEVHGRTIAFVPDSPLAPATIYRVTVAAGVTMSGSDQVLEAPYQVAFETSGPGGPTSAWDVGLGRPVLEAPPDEAPIIAVDLVQADTAPPLASLPFEIYRLTSFDAARAAATTLAGDPGWGRWASNNLVNTAGLTRVAAFQGVFETSSPSGYKVVRFPAALAAGWYLVVVPREGRDRQALLQVTTLSAFALTSETRTLAWVNDVATDGPVPGAEILGPDGASLGSTAADGLLDVATPPSLAGRTSPPNGAGGPPILVVAASDGRRLLVPLGLRSNTWAYDPSRDGPYGGPNPADRWWHLLSTDRTLYRPTDTIHAWGLIRSRSDDSVPADLELTLRPELTSTADGPWLAHVPVTATARGTWAADVAVTDLPLGAYIAELRARDEVVSGAWLSVDEIRKPAYQIEVSTDRHVVIAGDPVVVTGRAAFFDGSVAVGLDLRIGGFGVSKVMTTDDNGQVTTTLGARTAAPGFDYESISVAPDAPEEGELSGSTAVFVFASSSWITAAATVSGGQVVVGGSLNAVDLDRLEQELPVAGWPYDPAGSPIAGTTVAVRVVQNVVARTQIGTTYDYIEKRVVPIYDSSTSEQVVGTYTTTSGPAGEINLAMAVPDAGSTYTLTLTARDGSGRTATTTAYASPPTLSGDDQARRPYLGQPEVCGNDVRELAAGEAVELPVRDGDGSVSTGGRYLFVTAGRGIRSAQVQDTASITATLAEADFPDLDVMAVRFKDGAYVVTNEVALRPLLSARALTVDVSPDRARYAPGDHVTLTIRTTDPAGRPIPADVVVRGVDEKLFAIGGAFDVDVLGDLFQPLGDGLLQSYASHPLPILRDEGCGDTGGGGRDDFRDSVLFQLVTTGPDGRASVAFDLPDDLTSWHVSASALDADLRAGSGGAILPVGLPFFVDAVVASDYLAGEQPVLRVRSFGDGLAAGERVRYTISSPSLLLPPTTIEAAAFEPASLQLPALPLGVHEVTIAGTVLGGAARADTLVRKLLVRASRLEVAVTEPIAPDRAGSIGGPGLTTYVVTDAGRGSLLPTLEDLAHGGGARSDRLLAATIARELLIDSFGITETSLAPVEFDIDRYQRDGIALLPYASAELTLTAMMAIVAPDHLDADSTGAALRAWLADNSVTRERRIIALAGLAGLGHDVLDELHAVDVRGVTIREALWTALGLVASGDEDSARIIERGLLREHGQALGPWVRLDVGGSLTDTLDAASLLALVAAAIGDPLAPAIDRYVREMRTSDALYVLPEIGVIRQTLDRLPRAVARFAWTVDGARHIESLEPGASWSVALTARQRNGFRVEPLDGSIGVVASWSASPGPGDLPSGALVTITRTVTPAANAPTSGLVKVQLRIVFDAKAPTGCWDVVDRTPSGLAPLVNVPGWSYDETRPRSVLAPYEVSGQRVGWCIDPRGRRDVTLGYSARVVSAGVFTWEPAVIQSAAAPEVGATTPVTSYTIH